MELTSIPIHARNEPGGLETITPGARPARYGYKDPSALALRTDDDLVRASQLGDNEAFAELYHRHAQGVQRMIARIVRHHEDTEDALQETMLRAYAKLGGFHHSSKFSTWITAIGINTALGILRKKKSRRESDVEQCSSEEMARDIADQTPSPEHLATEAQIIFLLSKRLSALPPKIREVMTNYYGNDFTVQEAADALGISVGAIKSRLLRGRRSLLLSFERKYLIRSHRRGH